MTDTTIYTDKYGVMKKKITVSVSLDTLDRIEMTRQRLDVSMAKLLSDTIEEYYKEAKDE